MRFQAELYVGERGSRGASAINGIPPKVLADLTAHPDVVYADTLYMAYVGAPRVNSAGGVDFAAWTAQRIDQIWLVEPGALRAVGTAQPALVSETFARRFGVLQGGVVAANAGWAEAGEPGWHLYGLRQ